MKWRAGHASAASVVSGEELDTEDHGVTERPLTVREFDLVHHVVTEQGSHLDAGADIDTAHTVFFLKEGFDFGCAVRARIRDASSTTVVAIPSVLATAAISRPM